MGGKGAGLPEAKASLGINTAAAAVAAGKSSS
jgi:hypothetical protein